MYFLFSDRKGFQRVVILLGLGGALSNATSWPKRIGKLPNGENTSAVKPRSFLIRQIGEKAEIIFLNRFLSATVLEFAFGAMVVQDECRRGRSGQKRGDFADGLVDFARQGAGL